MAGTRGRHRAPRESWSHRSPTLTVLRLLGQASRGQTVTLGTVTVVGGLLPTVSALAMGALVGTVPAAAKGGFGSPAGHRLLVALAVVAGLYVVQQASAPLTAALTWSLGSRYSLRLRETVTAATLGPTGIAHLEDPKLADEIAAIEGTEARPWLRQSTVPSLATVTSTWLQGLGAAVVLLTFRWWAPLLLAAAWALTHRWVGREVGTFTKSLDASTSELRRSAYFRDLAMRPPAAKELRVFGLAGWAVDHYATLWRNGMGTIWRERRGHHALMVQAVAGVAIANAVVYGLLGRAALDGEIGVGKLVVYVQTALGTMALGAQGDPQRLFREGSALAHRATRLAARIRRADARIVAAARATAPAPSGAPLRAARAPEAGIRFEGVSFSYPGTDRRVLDRLDLWIPAGRSFAIVGTNGAGKTTLVKLLARLYEPTEGRITVDGVDIRTLDPASWLEQVGVIFQDFIRFELTCRDNVGLGAARIGADRRMLDAVARQVHADDLVAKLPNGWDTVLSRAYDGGTDLSGGEWQRVALARALLAVRAGASVLVLDEPTANLDVRAESDLFARTLGAARDTTTILVSHRLSSVRQVDRICVLSGGRVAEQGSHDELMARTGRYAQMFDLQAVRFRDEVAAHA